MRDAPPGEYTATLIAKAEDCGCVNTTDIVVEVKGPPIQTAQARAPATRTQTIQQPKTVTVTRTVSSVRTVTVERPQLDPTVLGLGIVGAAAIISAVYLLRRRPVPTPAPVGAA
ncbi:MAG: hypothetical protein QI199_01970 [Candidatus Korarchaeota archaeon]|nr:hypothetical protein [Candidatus Korarchaeota archaeon]